MSGVEATRPVLADAGCVIGVAVVVAETAPELVVGVVVFGAVVVGAALIVADVGVAAVGVVVVAAGICGFVTTGPPGAGAPPASLIELT